MFDTVAMDERFEERSILTELCEHIRIGNNWYQLGIQLNFDHRRLNDIHKLPKDST